MTLENKTTGLTTGKNVLYISILLTLLFVAWGAVFPANLDLVAGNALNFLTTNFAWLKVWGR